MKALANLDLGVQLLMRTYSKCQQIEVVANMLQGANYIFNYILCTNDIRVLIKKISIIDKGSRKIIQHYLGNSLSTNSRLAIHGPGGGFINIGLFNLSPITKMADKSQTTIH